MDALYIEKDLDWEDQLCEDIVYIPVAGASEESNFRAPDSFVFIFFEKCKGVHSVDFIEYEEKDNQIHISFPGQIHSWKTEDGAVGHKLIISRRFVETHLLGTVFSLQHINTLPVIDIPKYQSDKLRNEFTLLFTEIGDCSIPNKIAHLRTQLIINLISNLIESKKASENNRNIKTPIVFHYYDLIENYFIESKSVRFYADKLAVTPNYLNILVKAETGQTAKDIIDARVVLEAKRRLLGTNESIKEISFDLGFSSISFFYDYMFRKTGLYPKALRKISQNL